MKYKFPNPRTAPDFQPLCFGGDLSVECLISAYRVGIFPWFCENEPILWWSPNPRAILRPQNVRKQRSLKPFLKNYEVRFDTNFSSVINLCKNLRENEPDGTWISGEIIKSYENLHRENIAHSVEIYENNELIGGLYGLIFGKVFCGESMVSLRKNASKVALVRLCEILEPFEFLIDCQVMNDHLKFMGASEIQRDEFLKEYEILINRPSGFENFKDLI